MTGFEENGDGSCLSIGHVSDKLSGELSPDRVSSNTGPDTGCTEITILERDTGGIRMLSRQEKAKYKRHQRGAGTITHLSPDLPNILE